MSYTVYIIYHDQKKIYIGQTKNLEKREKQHKYAIKSKPSKLYQYARDNGLESFKLIPLRVFKTRTEAKRFEMYQILCSYFNCDDEELLNKIPNISDR